MSELGRSFLDKGQTEPSAAAEAVIRAVIARATDEGGGRILRCARCRHPVTSLDARIEVDGAHQHTRRNPAGFLFQIGCFRDAPGCAVEGRASEEWSWFPGHAWRFGLCKGCGGHLGWVFGREAARFYALIVDRLVADEGGEGAR